jgi:mRNA-degrading endonuclease toxin of MazEF toxin-antitoxin module
MSLCPLFSAVIVRTFWPEMALTNRTTHEPPAPRCPEGTFPHASGGRGKKSPVVVVQADAYKQRLHHAVVAQVTTNLDEKDDPSCLFIEAATPEGKGAGLNRDCLICCTLLSLMTEDRLKERVGNLSVESGYKVREVWCPRNQPESSRRRAGACYVPCSRLYQRRLW